ncbi:MAG: alpha/beta fold hydrolase [Acidimicrobiales bacterium]
MLAGPRPGVGRPLLAIHGFTGAKEDFDMWLGPLAERGWDPVSPDLRGHGNSDSPVGEANYTLDLLTADLVALIDALGWPSATIVGHSMGGILAQKLALSHPHLVDALVLIDSYCAAVEGVDPSLVALGSAIVRSAGMSSLADAMEAYRRQQVPSRIDPQVVEARHPGYQDYLRRKVTATCGDLWVALAPTLTSLEPWDAQLVEVAVPTLILVGEHDRSSRQQSEVMAGRIAGANLVVIGDAGHSPQFEAPDACWSALTDFLDSLSPDP